MPAIKKDWVLSPDAFNRLLIYLDEDRERAGEIYENLRQMLITFFEFRGLVDPEAHADDTINRVARRLSEGEQIEARPSTYFYAVARNVWREQLATRSSTPATIDELPGTSALADDPIEEREQETRRTQREEMLDCLERCLAELPNESRDLITGYYGEQPSKIQSRKQMAARLGIELNALRIRVCRLRAKVEQCVRDCVARRSIT